MPYFRLGLYMTYNLFYIFEQIVLKEYAMVTVVVFAED